MFFLDENLLLWMVFSKSNVFSPRDQSKLIVKNSVYSISYFRKQRNSPTGVLSKIRFVYTIY